MKKWLSRIVLAALIVIVGLVAFLAQFDVNQYKSEILDYVAAKTGRSMSVNGDIGFKLTLVPTLQVNGIAFENPTWAAHEFMATVERAEAQLELLPLLSGRLSLKKLSVVGARISLETDRRGRGNWIIDGEDVPADPDARTGLSRFDFLQISIIKSTVEYRSHGSRATEFAIHELHSKRTGYGQPVLLEARIRVADQDVRVHGTLSAFHRFLANEPYALSLNAEIPGIVIGISGEIQSPATGRGTHLELDVRAEDLQLLAEIFGHELTERGPLKFHATLNDTKKGYAISDGELETNASRLTLQMSIEPGRDPLKIAGRVGGRKFDLSDVLQAGSVESRNGRLFSDQPLELGWTHAIEVALELDIGTVVSPRAELSEFKSELIIADGEFKIDGLSATVAEGSIRADFSLDDSGDQPRAELQAKVAALVLGKLPRFSPSARISNGITDIVVDIKGSGQSVARIAGNARGEISVVARNAVLDHGAASVLGGDLLIGLVKQLNPLARPDSKTHLECVAIRFPITNGVARNDTGIGLLTAQLTVLGGGTLDLKTEQINIGVKPKPRTGVGLNVTSLVDFVRLGGTLKHPEIVTDAQGAATASLKVGAAVATVGLSVLAEGLFDRLTADTDPCSVALGVTSIGEVRDGPSAFQKTTDKTKDILEGAGEKVKGVFKSLFDN